MKIFALFAFILFVEFGSCEDVQYFSTVGDFISDYSETGSNVLDYVTLENDPKSNLPEENIKKFNVSICMYLQIFVVCTYYIIIYINIKLCSFFHCRFIMFLNPGLYHLFFRLCSVHNYFNTNSSSNDE